MFCVCCRIPKVFCLTTSVSLCVCCIPRVFVVSLVCFGVFVVSLGVFVVTLRLCVFCRIPKGFYQISSVSLFVCCIPSVLVCLSYPKGFGGGGRMP